MSMFLGRGGGSHTIERIDWKSTLKAIWWFVVIIVGIRIGLCLLVWLLIMCVGPQAGGLIAVSVSAYLYFSILQRRPRTNKYIPVALGTSLFLVFLSFFDYWPTLLTWSWIEHQMYWSWRGGEWIAAESSAVILRFLAGLVLPAIVWSPARWLDWALRLEVLWPGARETRFSPASPDQVPGADDWKLKSAQGAPRPVAQDDSPDVAYVPQPVYRG